MLIRRLIIGDLDLLQDISFCGVCFVLVYSFRFNGDRDLDGDLLVLVLLWLV